MSGETEKKSSSLEVLISVDINKKILNFHSKAPEFESSQHHVFFSYTNMQVLKTSSFRILKAWAQESRKLRKH